jgi:hypothetical protein
VAAEHLIDREISRAAEGVDRQPLPFEILDAGDVGTRDDRVAARFVVAAMTFTGKPRVAAPAINGMIVT